MGLFTKIDWNILAIIYEREGFYRVNGNRVKGRAAKKARDGAKKHSRTVYWAVFDQKGAFLEGDPGRGKELVPDPTMKDLIRELPLNKTVRRVLRTLEEGELERAAKPFEWNETAEPGAY